jgi:2-dehydro-3-deoxyphosphogluconate aldolase/(4S)-4-hydroxy-2-oxoglutarate aldolase
MRPLLDRLRETPVIAIFRAASADRFLEASAVLVEAGVTCLEYTLTSADAIATLAKAQAELPPEVTLGVGTVRTPAQVEQAADAGADFLVSQIHDHRLVEAARRREISFVPGALTPNEIVRAWSDGVDAVKVSPVGPLGGPDYVREIATPMPDVPLVATGGVRLGDVPAYLTHGAAAVGLSNWLFLDALDGPGSMEQLGRRAREVVARVSDHLGAQAAAPTTPATAPITPVTQSRSDES